MQDHFAGFDTSLNGSGLTVLSLTGLLYCGSLQLSGAQRGGERLSRIHDFFEAHLPREGVIRATIEGPSLKSVHREFDLGEVSGVAKRLVYSTYEVEPLSVPPMQLKLYATGDALASKAAVIHAVKTEWGYDAKGDDDAADSYVLAHIARALEIGPGRRRCEAQVVHDLLNPTIKTKVKHRRTREDV